VIKRGVVKKKRFIRNKTVLGIKLKRSIGLRWTGWIHRVPVTFVRQMGWNGKNILGWHARPRRFLENGREFLFIVEYSEGVRRERMFPTLALAVEHSKEALKKESWNDTRHGEPGEPGGSEHLPVYESIEEFDDSYDRSAGWVRDD